jgi:hypothetical protein
MAAHSKQGQDLHRRRCRTCNLRVVLTAMLLLAGWTLGCPAL